MHGSRFASALIALFIVPCAAAPVAAADPPPKAEIGVSYSILHNEGGTYPLGWVFAIGGNLTRDRFGEDKFVDLFIVGEIGGNYRKLNGTFGDVTVSEHSFLGGVKIASSAARAAVPFVQVLTGLSRAGVAFDSESQSLNAFALQPGAGVDVKIGTRAAIRLQADYRLIRYEGHNINEYRFAVGMVFGIGKR